MITESPMLVGVGIAFIGWGVSKLPFKHAPLAGAIVIIVGGAWLLIAGL